MILGDGGVFLFSFDFAGLFANEYLQYRDFNKEAYLYYHCMLVRLRQESM